MSLNKQSYFDMKAKVKHRFNEANEKAKYKYRIHKKRVKRKDFKTVIADLLHVREYEIFSGFKDFITFNDVAADKYINYLFSADYSLPYINDNLRALRDFLNWLERQRGYKKINYNHIEYLYITDNQRLTAKATEYKKSYTYDQIIKAVRRMPEKTIIQRRNKGIVSLQALCSLRVSELRTVKLLSLICEDDIWFIDVNPKYMDVKRAKRRQASFIQLPDHILQNVLWWCDYLISLGFKPTDPFFPIIPSQFNQRNALESNLHNAPIKSNTTIRDIFKKAFETAGYEYLRPHSFRHTMVKYAEKQTPEFMNAVRQSLGHSSIDVSFSSYGQLSDAEQRDRISGFEGGFLSTPTK